MVSMNETAPIYARDESYVGIYRQDGTEGTYQTRQVITSLTLELCRAPESIDEPVKLNQVGPDPELLTYSTFDNKFSGLAMRTTYIKTGTKVSALSSEFRCRIRPVCRLHPLHERRSMG